MSLLLVGLLQLGLAAATCGEAPKEPDRVLIIRHIGAEDRPVPPLLLYSADAQKQLAQYGCGKEASCFELPPATFSQLASDLRCDFFAKLADDQELQPAGSFEFTLEGPRGHTVLRLNKTHASQVLAFLLDRLKNTVARSELERRLSVARL